MTDRPAPRFEQVDSRRITGPHPRSDRPGAILDVRAAPEDSERFGESWTRVTGRLAEALGWPNPAPRAHATPEGLSCVLAAPVDQLYTATEVAEAGFATAVAELEGGEPPNERGTLERLVREAAEESCPPVREAVRIAREAGLPWLVDDECFSVGHGASCRRFAPAGAPGRQELLALGARAVPLALITGTNGKSTTTRMLAAIARAAGRTPGSSSTDGLRVGEEWIERGDYSGPGGAREVLRHPRTEIALLETARGGIVRRGLGVERADVAAVLNVAADHLGEWGAWTLEELADVKFTVTRAVGPWGRVVLGADSELVRERGLALQVPRAWFGLEPEGFLAERRAAGEPIATLADGHLVLDEGDGPRDLVAVDQVPAAFGGAARHNLANALAAALVARALGLEDRAIADGLRSFARDRDDNPGRHALFELNGVKALVDFAHNPHGQRAVLDMAFAMPAERRLVVLGQAGDRDDASVRELVELTFAYRPDRILVKDMPKVRRGRAEGEMVALIRAELERVGAAPDTYALAGEELETMRAALAWARPGDLLLLFVHTERTALLELLERLGREGWRPGDPVPR